MTSVSKCRALFCARPAALAAAAFLLTPAAALADITGTIINVPTGHAFGSISADGQTLLGTFRDGNHSSLVKYDVPAGTYNHYGDFVTITSDIRVTGMSTDGQRLFAVTSDFFSGTGSPWLYDIPTGHYTFGDESTLPVGDGESFYAPAPSIVAFDPDGDNIDPLVTVTGVSRKLVTSRTDHTRGFAGEMLDGTRYRWTPASGLRVLTGMNTMVGSGETFLSGDARAVLATGITSPFSPDYSVQLWTGSGGLQTLDMLPGTRVFRDGVVSNLIMIDGQPGRLVVMNSYDSDGSRLPQIWTSLYGAQPLATYLTDHGFDLAGWTLYGVISMSDDGQTMLVSGLYNGQAASLYLTGVPAPGAAAALGMGGLMMASRRRRR